VPKSVPRTTKKSASASHFAHWFRNAAPYINAFRGRTFVLVFGGEAVEDKAFANLVHDIALLSSLGIRLVLVHGARPQIEQRLKRQGIDMRYVDGLRVTDEAALACVKEAVGAVRVDIEALLSMGLANSPMAGAQIRVASGNLVTARPYGIRNGVDYLHTGEVRRVDTEAINSQLDNGAIVLLSPMGYSPSGEAFNLSAEDVATSVASALHAHKVLYLAEDNSLRDSRRRLARELSMKEAQQLLSSKRRLPDETQHILHSAVNLCLNGVQRVHILDRKIDGVLLQELFTRDGVGTLICADSYDGIRQATINDVAGILELIAPLEEQGTLVRRSREHLEMEINRFTVMERDGMIIACAALWLFEKEHAAELACLAVHPDYRGARRGETLLHYLEKIAQERGMERLFSLSTQTAHWFLERGFKRAEVKDLPMKRKALYNYQRNSKVYVKPIG
jgi:amino-acid N-acetyltransferase